MTKTIPKHWNDLTEQIIAAAIEVHSMLGPRQLENIDEGAMAVELGLRGIPFVRQHPIRVKYKGVEVGDLRLDLVVAGLVIVELKAIERIVPVHQAQLTTYLRSTGLPLGLLINFNHLRLVEGVSRRINPHSPLVLALPDLPPLSSASSAPSEFPPEDDQ